MLLIVYACLLICLFFIVVQDFRKREISWFFIPLLFAGFVVAAVHKQSLDSVITNILFNLSFVIIQLVLLTLYISVKNMKFINIVNTYIGIGDVLFFAVIAAAFSPFNFIIFYLISTILTLLGVVFFNILKRATTEIPLAGSMAGMMIALMILSFCVPALNFYNDDFFISCFNK